MGMDAMIFIVWMLSFKPAFSFSSFSFIKRLFSSSSLSAISLVWSAHLRLLIFLPAILIPACASSSLAFGMMYSAYKLNKQGDNIQPWRTPFPKAEHKSLWIRKQQMELWGSMDVPWSLPGAFQAALRGYGESRSGLHTREGAWFAQVAKELHTEPFSSLGSIKHG